MNIRGNRWKSIWMEENNSCIGVINQVKLPYVFQTCILRTCDEVVEAISSMLVRGAPLIGVVAAYGLMLAMKDDPSDRNLSLAYQKLNSSRPTAVNLRWALERVSSKLFNLKPSERFLAAKIEADLIADEDMRMCESIGNYGLEIIQDLIRQKPLNKQQEPFNVLTHCNAGWLATVDWGTALAPIYKAHRAGIEMHVWVDETRPRNQGASLTTFELAAEGVPHTLIVDNSGGYLMQKNMVDLVIVGADRVSSNGDACNKIGSYLKALAAKDNNIPFFRGDITLLLIESAVPLKRISTCMS